MLRNHLLISNKPALSFGGNDLFEISISKELSDCIRSNDLLKALKIGVGVNEFRYLQKNIIQLGSGTRKLLSYTG